MKKTILLSACIILAVFSAQAQTDPEQPKDKKIHFGLRTGYEFQVNSSNLNYKANLPYVGAFSNIRLSKKWSLQVELNLRSDTRERLLFNNSVTTERELFFTVPVLLKYKVSDKFSIYAGTQTLVKSLKTDVFGIKKWNGILGVEYNISEKFYIDARFRHGFEARDLFRGNFRNNKIGIGIGYRF